MSLSLGVCGTETQAASPKKQLTFVLVHGAWHGGWCYARVAELLRGEGHRVFTPTLTGLGERSHLANVGVINCSTHIKDILNVFHWEQLKDVVLCGHSYGGMVISGVADAIPNLVTSIVYLDTTIPQNGRSVLDGADPTQLLELLSMAADNGGHMLPPRPALLFNVNPADRAMVDTLCTPQPTATFMERLNLTGAFLKIAKKTLVIATGWGPHAVLRQAYEHAMKDKSWTAIEIPSGHDVMLDAPERVAEILLSAA
jgi:pimeloyl-ACP methyl ester carboxylesterase